jgi:hypothetical protein
MAKSVESKVAILSIVFAALHFIGETIWHFKVGQFLPMLIVDYIAVSLLIYGGIKTLNSSNAIGLLCGAWGFEFCLNYRALFGRVEKLLAGVGHGNPAIDATAYVLAVLLLACAVMFLITIYLTSKNARNA